MTEPLIPPPTLPPSAWLAATHDDRAAAVVAARAAADLAMVPVLLAIMRNPDQGDALRQSAGETLASLNNGIGVPALLELLRDPEADQRRQAAIALAKCPQTEIVVPLIQTLTDPVNTIRNLAERALLAQLEHTKVVGIPGLLELLRHPVPLTRSPAARLLGQTQDERALGPLMELATDPDWLTRMWAAKGLGDLGFAAAQSALATLLKDDDRNRVRAAASEAIGKLRTPESETLLRESMARDPDEGVKQATAEALRRLGFEIADLADELDSY